MVSNIAEGFERGTKQEFINYLYIAKGSAGEVRAQLQIALDIGYINMETFKDLNNLAQECSKLIQSFAEKIKAGARTGTQFKHIEKPDETKEIFKQSNPEMYKQLFG